MTQGTPLVRLPRCIGSPVDRGQRMGAHALFTLGFCAARMV